MIADLGSWKGRALDDGEWELLSHCQCPGCQRGGREGLMARGIEGFCQRATHNLWTLQQEARQIDERLADGSYSRWYTTHVDNSVYRPLIEYALDARSA